MSEKKKKKWHLPHKHLSPQQKMYDSFLTFSGGLALLYFSQHLQAHMHTMKIIAPQSGLYFYLYKYVTIYLHSFLKILEHVCSSSAFAVILLAIIIRICLMPLSLYNSKRHVIMNERVRIIAPQLKLIEDTMEFEAVNKKQRKELLALKHKTQIANGTLFTQWPFYILIVLQSITMIALYQSVAYSSEFWQSTFAGIHLGSASIGLTICASLSYLASNLIMIFGMTKQERKSLPQSTYWLSAVSIFCSGYFLPAILPLYWLTNGLFSSCQNYINYFILRPHARKSQHQVWQPQVLITQEKIDQIMGRN